MRKSIIALFLILFSSSYAALLDNSSSATYFDQLKELYDAGKKPDIAKVVNKMWAGRCFRNSSPDAPINSGYVVRIADAGDVGPIAHDDQYEAKTFWDLNKPANYFDSFTFEQGVNLPVQNSTFSLLSTDNANYFELKEKDSFLKASGKYLVEKIASTDSSQDIAILCYYFIPEYR